ncbi:MAG: DNA-processing protein DprA [Turneriella sp.]|nr:DNA-processing protein DprA [Turneriella sp.]
MAIAGDAVIHALALHRAHKFLSDKLRRLLEASGDFSRFTQLVLGAGYSAALKAAAAELETFSPAHVVAFTDADYPPLLKEISYAPFALYLRGNRSLLAGDFIALVGTREPSAAGRLAAANLAEVFTRAGKTIVSGIARGIDSVAHHAALAARGYTVAVLPNGFDHYYPLENRDLYESAANNADILLLSEYPANAKPQRHHFVRRNRIIAGLAPLTVFVEGDIKSGGMITVNHALSEGREVAALKHDALKNNAGGEKLIADGAADFTVAAFSRETRRESA